MMNFFLKEIALLVMTNNNSQS